MRWLLALGLLVLMSSLKAQELPQADDRPLLRWITMPYPPLHISDGPMAGKGIVDEYLGAVTASLSGYRHVREEMTPARAWQLIRVGENICHPGALYTPERAKYTLFSDSPALFPSLAFMVRLEDYKALFAPQMTIAAADMLARTNLRLGLVADRSYYVFLDNLLSAGDVYQRATVLSSLHGPLSLYRMLQSGRIDYIIEYPWINRYMVDTIQAPEAHELVALSIRELPQFAKGYVACPKTLWGERVIMAVNRWVAEQKNTETNRQRMAVWLDRNTLPRYMKAYEEMIAPVTRP